MSARGRGHSGRSSGESVCLRETGVEATAKDEQWEALEAKKDYLA